MSDKGIRFCHSSLITYSRLISNSRWKIISLGKIAGQFQEQFFLAEQFRLDVVDVDRLERPRIARG